MTRFLRNKLRQVWVPMFEKRCGSARDHILWPQQSSGDKAGPTRMHRVFCSTLFLLQYLLLQAMKGHESVLERAAAVASNFLDSFCRGTFSIAIDGAAGTPLDVQDGRAVHIEVNSGKLNLSQCENDEHVANRLQQHPNRPETGHDVRDGVFRDTLPIG